MDATVKQSNVPSISRSNPVDTVYKEITDYINSTKNLKEQYDTIRTGKIYKQEELKELYKPITQPLKKLTDEIRQKTLPTAEQSDTVYAQIMPKTLPEYVKNRPTLVEPTSAELLNKENIIKVIGKTAQKFLSNYASRDIKTDRTFGIRVENEDLFTGNQPIWIRDNNIKFDDGIEFIGTDGLWELLTLEEPKNLSLIHISEPTRPY